MSLGFDQTSMDQIARRAHVSRRTCFRYFPTKESLAFPYREQRLARFDELVRQGPAHETPYEAVRRAFLVMAGELMVQLQEVVALEQLVRRHPTLRARDREHDWHWEQVIAVALSRGDPQPLHRMVAGAVMGLIRAALDLWLESGGRLNLIELAHEAFLLLDHGVPALQ